MTETYWLNAWRRQDGTVEGTGHDTIHEAVAELALHIEQEAPGEYLETYFHTNNGGGCDDLTSEALRLIKGWREEERHIRQELFAGAL